MVYVFWCSAAFLFYAFAGYPLLVGVLALFRARVHKRAAIFPTVSLIVAAHNEAAIVAKKITNCLELDYPEDQREIIVASDGSTDATVEIARSFAARGVKVIELPEKRGKHFAQMIARDAAKGEILVFTDASVHLQPESLQRIVANFADPKVGCVSSEDESAGEGGKWKGERSYVQIEILLRRLESKIGSLVSASGSFFAVRRELCGDWHPHQSSDFFLVLHTVARGFRGVVDPACRAQVGIVSSEKAELRRKVRTIVHGLDVFFSHLQLVNPFRFGLFPWQLVSHKLFRWLVPFPILGLLISNCFLWKAGTFYRVALILQAGLYAAGLLAMLGGRVAKLKVIELAGYFLLGNVATLIAWLKFCTGERYAYWEPTRRG